MNYSQQRSSDKKRFTNPESQDLVIRSRQHHETSSDAQRQRSTGSAAAGNRQSIWNRVPLSGLFLGDVVWDASHQQNLNDTRRDPQPSDSDVKADKDQRHQPANDADNWFDDDQHSNVGSDKDDWEVEEVNEETTVNTTAVGHYRPQKPKPANDLAVSRQRLADLEAQVARMEEESRRPRGPRPIAVPGHTYGDIVVRGQGKVYRGNVTSGSGPMPQYVKVHQYGRAYADSGAQVFDGDVHFETTRKS